MPSPSIENLRDWLVSHVFKIFYFPTYLGTFVALSQERGTQLNPLAFGEESLALLSRQGRTSLEPLYLLRQAGDARGEQILNSSRNWGRRVTAPRASVNPHHFEKAAQHMGGTPTSRNSVLLGKIYES